MRKRWIVIILFATGIVCYISAFSLFFDGEKARTAIKNSPAGPVLSEINEAVKVGFKAPSGCKPSDFAGDLKKITISSVNADIDVKRTTDILPSVDFMDSVSCHRSTNILFIKIPVFSKFAAGRDHRGDITVKGEIPDKIILYLPEKSGIEVEAKTASGNIKIESIQGGI